MQSRVGGNLEGTKKDFKFLLDSQANIGGGSGLFLNIGQNANIFMTEKACFADGENLVTKGSYTVFVGVCDVV